jgi:hypothetical protein
VDTVFGSKMRSDFQNFPKISKILEKFAMVLEFLGEFSGVSRAAEKWKNNSGIWATKAHRHKGTQAQRHTGTKAQSSLWYLVFGRWYLARNFASIRRLLVGVL